MREADHEVTEILRVIQENPEKAREAANRLFSKIYDELHLMAGRLTRHQGAGKTLQATALVHEAYLHMIDRSSLDWRSRAHFFGIAARAMRQILVDHAREAAAAKRGGGLHRVTFDSEVHTPAFKQIDVLDFDRVLTRLAEMDERAARVVEYRVFAGMSVEQVSQVLGVSVRTVSNDWRAAKMWVNQQMAERT